MATPRDEGLNVLALPVTHVPKYSVWNAVSRALSNKGATRSKTRLSCLLSWHLSLIGRIISPHPKLEMQVTTSLCAPHTVMVYCTRAAGRREYASLVWCLSVKGGPLASTLLLILFLLISTFIMTIVFFQHDLFNGIVRFVP